MRLLIGISLLFSGFTAMAQSEHSLARRLVVFPLQTSVQYRDAAEEAWWEIRRVLTDNKRFLVASKNFLQQKDVFQSRGSLKPADAIILGQLLDANAVITTYLKDLTLHMKVYEGEYGRLLWQQELRLQPSVPVSKQLVESGVKLVRDFISAVPYQGYVVLDGLKSDIVYAEDGRQYFKAEISSDADVQVGDKIQLVRVVSDTLKPVFANANVEIYAEGVVDVVERQTITVHLKRVSSIGEIKKDSLVRIPKELNRLKDKYALNEELRKNINPEYFSPEMTELDQELRENKPLVTSLSFLGNLALFLLIAL